MPPNCGISKDTKENRWRGRSRLLASEKSRSYGSHSEVDDWGAMVFVIRFLWLAHPRSEGDEMPWEFEEEVDGAVEVPAEG